MVFSKPSTFIPSRFFIRLPSTDTYTDYTSTTTVTTPEAPSPTPEPVSPTPEPVSMTSETIDDDPDGASRQTEDDVSPFTISEGFCYFCVDLSGRLP